MFSDLRIWVPPCLLLQYTLKFLCFAKSNENDKHNPNIIHEMHRNRKCINHRVLIASRYTIFHSSDTTLVYVIFTRANITVSICVFFHNYVFLYFSDLHIMKGATCKTV